MLLLKQIIIVCLLYLPEASAQLSGADSVYTLDSVIVTSVRAGKELLNVPYSIEYSDKDAIQRSEAGISLDEISAGISGLDINNRRNYALGDKIIIRGIGARSSFGVRGIKIIYDGIPLTLPDGQTQLNNIDLSSAGRIEVLKGPASSLYGNSAGGVINIQTEIPSADIISISPQFVAGSFGLQKYSAKASGSSGSYSYIFNLTRFNYKGYREHSSASSSTLNGVINTFLSEKVLLKTVINYFNTPYLQNPGSLNKADAENNPSTARSFIKQQGAGEKISQLQTGVTLNYFAGSYNIDATAYYVNRSLINPIPGRIIDLKRSSGGFRGVFSTKIKSFFAELNLQAGTDLELQFDKRKEFENNGLDDINIPPEDIFKNLNYGENLIDQDETVLNSGSFISSEFIFSKKLRLTTGLRFDYYEFEAEANQDEELSSDEGFRIMKSLNPMAGIVFHPAQPVKLYANYSTSFLTPTTSELSNRPDLQGGFNPDLKPENIYNIEIGSQIFFNRLALSSAVYYMSFTDMLLPYQIAGSEETFFRNAGEAKNTGAEISADYLLGKNLSASVNYSYNNFVFSDYILQTADGSSVQLKDNKVPGIPRHRIGFTAAYQVSGFYSKIMLNWNDEYFADDFNGQANENDDIKNYINESYTEVNVRTAYIISISGFSLEIFGGINNLLNERYNSSIIPNAAGNRFFEPSPGRNWFMGIKGSF
ncbi:MAG: TonB-dependent receptor [Ignavibacteriaceae bacterium]